MFIDIVGFSKIAERINPKILVTKLNNLFSEFDAIIEKYKLEKIKTIGDAYLAVGGLGVDLKTNPIKCVLAALEIQNLMQKAKDKSVTFILKIVMKIGLLELAFILVKLLQA